MKQAENIFTVFDQIVSKEQKEQKLKQKAKVLWFTGLSGSGKTTLGASVEKELFNKIIISCLKCGEIYFHQKFTETIVSWFSLIISVAW